MRTDINHNRVFMLCILTFTCILFVSCFTTGCIQPRVKFTKTVTMPVIELMPGSSFEVTTFNGLIETHGSDVNECRIIATIEAYAKSLEGAEEYAEQTTLNYENSDEGLVLNINRPEIKRYHNVSVSLDITIPENINIDLETYNGSIKIENIAANTEAKTRNGKITLNDISGKMQIETYNGKITANSIEGDINLKSNNGAIECKEISGNIKLHTSNGQISAHYSETAPPGCDIEITTNNGGITLTTPPDYSAEVNASTHNGSVNTKLPVTITGRSDKKQIIGNLGDGKGNLKLETSNGSITIK